MVKEKKARLIDEHVSAEQCKKAVDALLKHEKARSEKQQEALLLPGKEQSVWLQVAVKQMHSEKKLKPHKIPIAHPLVDPRVSPVCLITKDPQREYKDLLEKHNIKFINRVVGVTKLKGKFKPFEARRLLLKENELFLADERVVPLLPGLLGKKFFEAKKQPIPVDLTKKDVKGELEQAISSTYFHQNQGTCSSIKIGTLSQSSAHVQENIEKALPAIVKAIKGGWDNIQSLQIKTSSSTSLPIWTCDLGAGAGGRWDGLQIVDTVEDVSDEGEKAEQSKEEAEESEEEVPTTKKRKTVQGVPPPEAKEAKSKKRATESTDSDKPKKKSKTLSSTSEPVAPPITPASKKTKADPPSAAPPPPPPNTPATGLATPTPGGSKKRRKVQDGETSASATLSSSPKKGKPPKPATQESEPKTVEAGSIAPKVDKKPKKGKSEPSDSQPSPALVEASLTAQELKQKKSVSTVEKKKEKLRRVKRSAKDAVIGKKV